MRPDADPGTARRLIARVARRRFAVHAANAILAAVVTASAIAGASRWFGAEAALTWAMAITLGATAGCLVLWRTAHLRSRAAVARAIEAAEPRCRNVLITAEEFDRHPERAAAPMAARVFAEADRRVEGVHAGGVAPLRWGWICVAAAFGLLLLWSPVAQQRVGDPLARIVDAVLPGASAETVRFTIDPPGYSGVATSTVTDPERIEVLEGGRIRAEAPAAWRVRFGDTAASELIARTSGYFAVEDAAGALIRLIPVTVLPDRAPVVRVEKPAKDLLLPDGNRTIPVTIAAADDLALSALELRYTKVSGSGEQFEFVEGTLPIELARASEREWRADGALALAALNLGPGDSLVYRAVARDRRPGDAGLASSDTYFLEIAGPGQVALEGVDMPPDLERYAMSQQMIVLKLERLKAKMAALERAALIEEAASIAAEQRTVRANFVFLLGGHVEDEEEEAEQSHEIQEGRLENSARKDINAAISQMTRVEQGLTAIDVAAALPPAKAAVESLQRAFGRSRYLLRSLATRSRLDPSRRLTGDLAGAVDWRRQETGHEPREGEAVRRLLADLLDAVAAAAANNVPGEARRRTLAESALAVDPASPVWQQMAQRLLEADAPREIDAIVADLTPLSLRGLSRPTAIEPADSPVVRSYKTERRQ